MAVYVTYQAMPLKSYIYQKLDACQLLLVILQ